MQISTVFPLETTQQKEKNQIALKMVEMRKKVFLSLVKRKKKSEVADMGMA